MKSFDEYIKKNTDLFDSDEPLPGHFERFALKQDQESLLNSKRSVFLILRIAAAVVFAVVLSYAAFQEFRKMDRNFGNYIIAIDHPELNEAEQFYSKQLVHYYGELKNLSFENDKVQKRQILDELSDMDKQVQLMKQDLIQNPDDERIVHAIINYYQVKIELMDMIIKRTQESNNTNNLQL